MKKRERAGKLSLFFCPEIKNGDASIAGSRSKLADARFSRRPHFHNLREQVPPVYNAFLISWKASRLLDGVNSPFPFFWLSQFSRKGKESKLISTCNEDEARYSQTIHFRKS